MTLWVVAADEMPAKARIAEVVKRMLFMSWPEGYEVGFDGMML